jgi:hypothetical protein
VAVSADPEQARRTEEETAAGIYGVIVSAAVMAASHVNTVWRLELTVLLTLVVYWGAERYSRLVAGRIARERRPSRHEVRILLTTGWAFVTASALPLAVLALLGVLGADVSVAVTAALVCSTVLLCVAGWSMGRGGQLRPLERLASAGVAGAFGVVMILLKSALH